MEGIIIYDRRQAGEDGRISGSSCSEMEQLPIYIIKPGISGEGECRDAETGF